MGTVTVKELFKRHGEDLQIDLISGGRGLVRKISVAEVNRPGLALAGFFGHFRGERVQIFGKGEHAFLQTISPAKRRAIFDKFLAIKALPCVAFTHGLEPPSEMIRACETRRIPLVRSRLETAKFIADLTVFLDENLAQMTTVHGVLIDVFGLGILLLGDSGVGKSETALELIKRGHMLVADDVVEIHKHAGGILIGRGREIIKHHMEIRGIGILNIPRLFGVGTILDRAQVNLVIHLESWDPKKEYDRLGLDDHKMTILGVNVPNMTIPVYSGRNLSVLIEVASLNHRLKTKGYYAARELDSRLISIMRSAQRRR